MTAIKDEYISDDIVRSDLLPISFLEKSAYTGAKGGLRFRLEKVSLEAEEGKQTKLIRCISWPGPFSYEHTESSLMEEESFPFSEEGLHEICDHLNKRLTILRSEGGTPSACEEAGSGRKGA